MNAEMAIEWSNEVPMVIPPVNTVGITGSASTSTFPENDVERAQRFAAHIQGTLRYVHSWKTWFFWDSTRWVRDEGGNIVFAKAQEMPKLLLAEASEIDSMETCRKAANAAIRAGDKAKLEAMIDLAKRQLGIATKADLFDCNPFLLGVRNGIVDLSTGKFRESRREDFITKQAGTTYDADATCPLWERFLPGTC